MVHFIFMLLLLGFFTTSYAADPGETTEASETSRRRHITASLAAIHRDADDNLLMTELAHINLAPAAGAEVAALTAPAPALHHAQIAAAQALQVLPVPRDIATKIRTALQTFADTNNKYGIEYYKGSLYLYPHQLDESFSKAIMPTMLATTFGTFKYLESNHFTTSGQVLLVIIALWVSCAVVFTVIVYWYTDSHRTTISRDNTPTKFLCKLDAAGLTYYHGHIPNTINWDDLINVNTKLEEADGPFCTQSLIINQRPGISLKVLVTNALPIDHYQLHQLMQDCVRIVRNDPRYLL